MDEKMKKRRSYESEDLVNLNSDSLSKNIFFWIIYVITYNLYNRNLWSFLT